MFCSHVSGDVIVYNSMLNIFKTEAAQTKPLPAQIITNEAQTNKSIWGEFGVFGGGGGGLSDLRMTYKYYFNI